MDVDSSTLHPSCSALDTLTRSPSPNASQQGDAAPNALTPPQSRSWTQQGARIWRALCATSVNSALAQLADPRRSPRGQCETQEALEQLQPHERQPIVNLMKAIYPDNNSGSYTGRVIAALSTLAKDDRTAVIDLAKQLVSWPRSWGFAPTLRVLGGMDAEDRPLFTTCVKSLFRFNQNDDSQEKIIVALAAAPPAQWLDIVTCTAQVLSTVSLDGYTFDEPDAVALFVSEPEGQRQALVAHLASLTTNATSLKRVVQIGRVLTGLPADQRGMFVQLTQGMAARLGSFIALPALLQELQHTDPAQRLDVATWSAQVYQHAAGDDLALGAVARGLAALVPSDRSTVAAALIQWSKGLPLTKTAQDLIAILAQFPADERGPAVDSVLQLPDLASQPWSASDWLAALLKIDPDRRHDVTQRLCQFPPGAVQRHQLDSIATALVRVNRDDHECFAAFAEPFVRDLDRWHFAYALEGLAAIGPDDRGVFCETMRAIMPDDVEHGFDATQHGPLLAAVGAIWPRLGSAEGIQFAGFARRFLSAGTIARRSCITASTIEGALEHLRRIARDDRGQFIAFAQGLVRGQSPDNPDLGRVDVPDLVAAWNAIDPQDRSTFVAFAAPYLPRCTHHTWVRVLEQLTRIPGEARPQFAAFADRLGRSPIHEYAEAVLSAWHNTPQDDYAAFAEFAHRYRIPHENPDFFARTLADLRDLPIADRAAFINFAEQLTPPGAGAEFVQNTTLLPALVRVLPANRQRVLDAMQPVRRHGNYSTLLLRAVRAGAETDFEAGRERWGLAPRVDRENVMNERRQKAADAAEAALYAAHPDYTDPSADLRAIKQHLDHLQPQLAVSRSEQIKQWGQFAQHMQAFSSNNPTLQALVRAMQQSPPEGRVPDAWPAMLQAFLKQKTSYREGADPEHMHQFYGADDGTPLAGWLGHLNQFAFIDAACGLPQSDHDKDLEAFTAHVRKFEVATIPALARVRGATRATELTNAQRIFYAVRGTQDVVSPIMYDDVFQKLCGLTWHVIQKSPEANRPNEVHSLILALAQCMEDDNHAVCGIGRRQRLVAVLEAQGCTPGEKLSALAQDFSKRHLVPEQADLDVFIRDATQEARDTFGAGSRDMQTFEKDLAEYVAITYGS